MLRELQDLEYEQSERLDRIRADNSRVWELLVHQDGWKAAVRLQRMNEMSPASRRKLILQGASSSDEEESIFVTSGGTSLPEQAVKNATQVWDGQSSIPVKLELLCDDSGAKDTFTYWITDEGDIQRARQLIPISPLTLLGRICSRVAEHSQAYNSPDDLFLEMMESGTPYQISALMDVGMEADAIVEQLTNEILNHA